MEMEPELPPVAPEFSPVYGNENEVAQIYGTTLWVQPDSPVATESFRSILWYPLALHRRVRAWQLQKGARSGGANVAKTVFGGGTVADLPGGKSPDYDVFNQNTPYMAFAAPKSGGIFVPDITKCPLGPGRVKQWSLALHEMARD
ncbi:hypothetical protein [Streptomyces sp. 1222.5]|uniref:hypothetical protein n=1 Tax=Streptomyces sp. 1222.5 TaxID=1881026 RepID=UPI003D724442